MASKNQITNACDKANRNFKLAFTTGGKKFDYGHNWLTFKSNIFLKESNNNFPKRYPYYKRGTILFVDFGVNIGGEFSGRHFAISLNKNDDSYTSTITVIPLTSKGGKKKIRLGKALIKPYSDEIEKSRKKLIDELSEYKIQHEEFSKIFDDLAPLIDNLENKYENADDVLRNEDKIEFLNLMGRRFNTDKEYTDKELNDIFMKAINDIIDKRKELEKLSKINSKNVTQLNSIINNLENLKTDSFALQDHIYTISKQKVIKRNRHDPTGKITIDENSLEILSENLARKFTLA